ncbi:MAG: DUF2911 domain-containing protein [Gemmatimonadota bacterium]
MTKAGISRLAAVGLVAFTVVACRPDGGRDAEMAADDTAAETATQGEATADDDAPPPVAAPCWTEAEPAELAERASPLDSTSVALGAGTVKVCHGSPQMRGRDVMGALVPFDRPWRLGANEATRIHMPSAGTIAGVEVGPGWYSLYTIPSADSWEIVVNESSERWGIPISEEVRAADIGSGTVNVRATDAPVEGLTMTLTENGADAAILTIEWAETRVQVPIELTGGDGG